MSDHVLIAAAVGLAVGSLLGLGFFGALLLTVRALPRARHPGLLALASLLARLALVAGGLFLLVGGGVPALAAALVGMLAVRTVLVRRAGVAAPAHATGETTWT